MLASACAGATDSEVEQISAEQMDVPSSTSEATTQDQQATQEVQRPGRMPYVVRPECSNGRVTRVVPGHSGWPSLDRAAAGLLRHPGADHAAISPIDGGRAIVVLYRDDDTAKAAARLRRLDSRWFPDSIAVCRSTVS